MSLLSVSARTVSDDTILFKKEWKELEFEYKKCPNFCNWRYIVRVLFRMIDVLSRVSILSVTWIAVKGYTTAVLIILD